VNRLDLDGDEFVDIAVTSAGRNVFSVFWGHSNGSAPQIFRFKPGTHTAAVSHRYREEGKFTIHLTWGDDRGAANSADLKVTVLESHGDPSCTAVPPKEQRP
jgi:hypothetical protein